MIERVAAELRRPAHAPGASLDGRIMRAVHAEARAMRAPLAVRATRSSWRWLREPRSIVLSPVQVGALAAGFALVAVGFGMRLGGGPATEIVSNEAAGAGAPVAHAAAAGAVPMQFVYVAPGARSVSIVGDFNDWVPGATPLVRAGTGGMWVVSVPLGPGRHEYAFVVDGTEWMPDPSAPRALGDDFGAPSSVVTVGEHST